MIVACRLFYILLLLVLLTPRSWAAEQIDPALYRGLRETAEELMRRYPPDQYYYIGLGRSPAGVMKMLEALGHKGKNIPLSKMGHIKSFDPKKLKAFLAHHFAEQLPPASELHGKKMLFLDWANKGGTLVNTKKILDEVLTEKPAYLALHNEGQTVPFINFKLDKVEKIPLKEELAKEGIGSFEVNKETALGRAFDGGSKFDGMAEYPAYNVETAMNDFASGKPYVVPEKRAEYDAVGAELRSYLASEIPGNCAAAFSGVATKP